MRAVKTAAALRASLAGVRTTRTILAFLVSKDGTPRPTLTVARHAAAQLRPGRAGAVRGRRSGTGLLISFRAAPRATARVVSAKVSNQGGQLFFLQAKARSVTMRFVPNGVRRRVAADPLARER